MVTKKKSEIFLAHFANPELEIDYFFPINLLLLKYVSVRFGLLLSVPPILIFKFLRLIGKAILNFKFVDCFCDCNPIVYSGLVFTNLGSFDALN